MSSRPLIRYNTAARTPNSAMRVAGGLTSLRFPTTLSETTLRTSA
jgi:hypothetical protein